MTPATTRPPHPARRRRDRHAPAPRFHRSRPELHTLPRVGKPLREVALQRLNRDGDRVVVGDGERGDEQPEEFDDPSSVTIPGVGGGGRTIPTVDQSRSFAGAVSEDFTAIGVGAGGTCVRVDGTSGETPVGAAVRVTARMPP